MHPKPLARRSSERGEDCDAAGCLSQPEAASRQGLQRVPSKTDARGLNPFAGKGLFCPEPSNPDYLKGMICTW
jgi:hypothetical protein